jgi:hypothetical protein
MSQTYHFPGGGKIRVASQRRYVVVSTGLHGKTEIRYRTDELTRVEKRAHPGDWVIDQDTGEVFRPWA